MCRRAANLPMTNDRTGRGHKILALYWHLYSLVGNHCGGQEPCLSVRSAKLSLKVALALVVSAAQGPRLLFSLSQQCDQMRAFLPLKSGALCSKSGAKGSQC